jgi:hypothetical protein
MNDKKSVLKWKALALGLALLFVAALVWTVRHYFYILDAYYYTAEFHVLLMVNNLKKANVGVLVEYFHSIGSPLAAAPSLFLAHLVQNAWALFSKPILPTVAVVSLGGASGAAATLMVLFLVGLLSFGLGVFFFGDLLGFVPGSWSKDRVSPRKSIEALSILGLAVPYLPLFIALIPAAIFRIAWKRMMIVLACGLLIRMVLSFWVSAA